MKYKLRDIDCEKVDEIIMKSLAANGYEKQTKGYAYSYEDIDTICFIIISKLFYLFSLDLKKFIISAYHNRIGKISDDNLKKSRLEFTKTYNLNYHDNIQLSIYALNLIVYSVLYSLKECKERGTYDPFFYITDIIEYFSDVNHEIFLDLDDIFFSYYHDKKNNINSLCRLTSIFENT